MQVITGAVKITGVGPRNADVEIIDSDGLVVGRAKADVHGNFIADDLDLGEGEHEVFARCTQPDGLVCTSEPIGIAVEGSPDDSEAPEPWSEARQEWENRYIELIEAAAAEYDFDETYARVVVRATERTINDFTRDVQELIELECREARDESDSHARMQLLRQSRRSGRP